MSEKGGKSVQMQKTAKRVIAISMAVAMTLSFFGRQVSALQYSGTDSYMSGKYYRKLQQVKLTGDPRTDIVAVARSQVGYQEGSFNDQLSGEIYGGENFTEYGDWYGLQAMWCAMFVSWCAARAGISTDTVPSHSYTPDGLNWFAERGLAYSRTEVQSRKYTPRPGDLIYFKSSRNAKITNHVGIVTGYSNNRIYTVEGNIGAVGRLTNGGLIAEQSYPITNTYIVYICSPNYESGSTNIRTEGVVESETLCLESLRNAVFAAETGDRLCYGAVHTDSAGRVSLGCGQWYGAQAVRLLCQIRAEDEALFGGLEADLLLSTGMLLQLGEEQCERLRTILTSDAGIRVQNAWMDQSLERWMENAKELGVTDRDGLLLCAALCHFLGDAVAERIVKAAGENPDKQMLLNAIKEREPRLYRTCCLLVE